MLFWVFFVFGLFVFCSVFVCLLFVCLGHLLGIFSFVLALVRVFSFYYDMFKIVYDFVLFCLSFVRLVFFCFLFSLISKAPKGLIRPLRPS